MSDPASLVLGTVQWGLPYGVANRTGRPPREEIAALLAAAKRAGIGVLDTARAYGESEAVIGALTEGDAHWSVVTKLDPEVGAPALGRDGALRRADASLAASRAALRRQRLDVLLLHRAHHRHAWGGALWQQLRGLREAGAIGALGVSAGSPAEAWALLEDPDVEVLQVAASLLDQRLARAGFFERARRLGRRVFVRSAFLQGVAHLAVRELPPHLQPLAPVLEIIGDWARERGLRASDAFLLYLRHLVPARVVVGCETAGQLCQNLISWRRPEAGVEALRDLAGQLPLLPDDVLDPSRWAPAGRSAGAARPARAGVEQPVGPELPESGQPVGVGLHRVQPG